MDKGQGAMAGSSAAAKNQQGQALPRTIFPSSKPLEIPEETGHLYDQWLAELQERFDDPQQDNNIVVRDTLAELFLGQQHDVEADLTDPEISLSRKILLTSFDPRNATLEPEYYSDLDPDRYYPRKPFIWFWQQFDRSPLASNLDLLFRVKRLLAPYIFKSVGQNLKVFSYVEFTYGYNLTIGDNVVLHRNVFLDDRGEIILRNRASVSDYVAIFSHIHDIHDQKLVTLGKTEIGEGARITYHSTVLSGVHLGDDSMLGAHGLATRSIPEHTVAVGLPAKPVKTK